jgi:hypothetical protein
LVQPAGEPSGVTWRTYVKGSGDYGEVTRAERTDVPASTAALPLEYTKRVKAEHLDSIARLGLLATADGVVFHGYSKGTPFATRDVYLLAVWLGKDGTPGASMQPDDGAVYAELKIKVSKEFRDRYLRDIRAVLWADDTGSGNTVLSFASIPAASIYLTLTGGTAARVKEIDRSAKVQAGEFALPVLYRDMPSIMKALQAQGEEKST